MDRKTKERTAPIASVGADAGQPYPKHSITSIPAIAEEINDETENLDDNFDMLEETIRRMQDPAYLPTITMQELFENIYQSKPPVIQGLLHTGAYLLAGAPKIGKSFLVAQIAYHVSTGQPLWGYEVHQGTVLYLALEDDHQRLQDRMYRMFGVEGTDRLHFAVWAKQLGRGLDEQLERFVVEHPDTQLIIIDTLQKVRELGGEAYSYADDYQVMGRLKLVADRKNICLLVVHHTRKTPSGDKFEMISGTTGILGCADGALILQKEKRTDQTAQLDVVGRDQPDQRLFLVRDQERLVWNLDHADQELWRASPDPLLQQIVSLLTEERPRWQGSATELCRELQLDFPPNSLTKRLNVKAGELSRTYGIRYEHGHSRTGSKIVLTKLEMTT